MLTFAPLSHYRGGLAVARSASALLNLHSESWEIPVSIVQDESTGPPTSNPHASSHSALVLPL